jgi:hypothetical protein
MLEALFLRTIEDIEKWLVDPDPYEVLRIAGHIRKLFLNGFPLVDQVNISHKIKLLFEVTVPADRTDRKPYPAFWAIHDGLDPDTAPSQNKRCALTREQFFQTVVLMMDGEKYTVQDVVLFEANVMGRVHPGAARTEKERALRKVNAISSVGSSTSALRQLQAIARIVLKSLEPLRLAVSKQQLEIAIQSAQCTC